jgi:hypothetical protein
MIFWDYFGQLSSERLSLMNLSLLESVESIPLEMVRVVMGMTMTAGMIMGTVTTIGGSTMTGRTGGAIWLGLF